MSRLFVDDRDERCESFLKNHPDIKVVIAKTFEAAKEAIEKLSPFDVIYLDHDLGDDQIMCKPGTPGSGSQLAEAIAALPTEKIPSTVILHTWNMPASHHMKNILNDAGISAVILPFNNTL